MKRKSRTEATGSRLVYSTEKGRVCPGCGWPEIKCVCSSRQADAAASDGIVRVGRQTKGRKGKGVTIITGIPLNAVDMAALAKQLKRKCGSGGTVKDGVIEIQGDHREALVVELSGLGWTVKQAGG